MKKYILLLSLVVIAIGWTACSEPSNGPGCRIKGYLSFKEYKKVYLTDNSENRIDSCEVKDGRFYLEEKGNISEPYVAIIHMTAEQDSTDQLDMPVAIENGTIKVELGEYIKLSGTPLNTRIKEFLDALQHCKDGVVSKTDITPEEISEIFSQFYKQQILSNKDNAVGEYIYRNYSVHLNTDDNKQVKAQMGN